jgi:dethiobiotin synthetase
MLEGLFVTGTDTGVGKTIVASALVAALRARGVRACGTKPVESGCGRDPGTGELVPADGVLLRAASGDAEPLEAIAPVRLEHPLAPLAASRTGGAPVDPARLVRAVEELKARHEMVVVEGIGGFKVPLAEGFMVADLAERLGLPVLVVASPFLGTINHTLLTVEAAGLAGLEVKGVVLCFHRPQEDTLAESTNPGMLEELLLDVPLLGIFDHQKDMSPAALAVAAEEAVDIGALFGF